MSQSQAAPQGGTPTPTPMPMQTNTGPEPPKPDSLPGAIRRIVTGNNDALNGSIVTETRIPIEQTGYWGMSQACIWKTAETPSDDTNVASDVDGALRTGDRMQGYVQSNGTNFFIQDFAPGAVVPMVT